jgi:hypothetical protein
MDVQPLNFKRGRLNEKGGDLHSEKTGQELDERKVVLFVKRKT